MLQHQAVEQHTPGYMSDSHVTTEQSAHRWLLRELIEDFSRNSNVGHIHEFLEWLDGFDRDVVLQALFWYAIEGREWTLAEHCIEEGYVLAPEEVSDCGPLHDALWLGDRADVIEWLIQHGAEVDRRGVSNMTPLLFAIGCGYENSARILVQHGADVNASTEVDDDTTPLMAAAETGNRAFVEMLLAHGADRERKNRWGKNAAEIAQDTKHQEIANLLCRG